MDKSEILVHVSAPSGAGDDARYRAQVEAILNFQSHSRELITLKAHSHSPPPRGTSEPLPKTTASATEIVNPPPCHVPLSGHIQPPKRHASQDLKDSLDSPVSVIPDSQPQPVQPGFTLDAESLSLQLYSPVAFPSKRLRVGSPPLEHSQHQHDELQDEVQHQDQLQSQIPENLTTAPILVLGENETKENEEPVQNHPQENISHPEPQPQIHPPNRPSDLLNLTMPLQIKPPPPPISSSPFTTHITPTLSMLATRLKSPRTFNPKTQTRDLDKLERGYWFLRITLVPCLPSQKEVTLPGPNPNPTTWDTPFFTKFWTFLSDFIAKDGRAGWGVWCILESENENECETNPSHKTNEGGKEAQAPEHHIAQPQSLNLKVYAWGEIASHVYLLLFLASDRRIRKLGAQWRDARDEVVIQMP
ncbi:hypothetical protein BJX99DRAFT_144794 [Aspergillus californicus]